MGYEVRFCGNGDEPSCPVTIGTFRAHE